MSSFRPAGHCFLIFAQWAKSGQRGFGNEFGKNKGAQMKISMEWGGLGRGRDKERIEII